MNKQNKYFDKKKLILIMSILFSLFLLIFFSTYTGLVTYHEGLGGQIYGIRLIHSEPTFHWAGIYGAAFGVDQEQPWQFQIESGSMTEANVFFQCMDPSGDTTLFASPVPQNQFNVNSLSPATQEQVDAYIGINENAYDSATNTFTSTMSINVGGSQISNIPAVETRVGSGADQGTFKSGILVDDDDNIIIAASVASSLVTGFNERFYNFQLLVPTPSGDTTDYHIFLDPTITCPEGDADEGNLGTIEGLITDTSGNRIENVLVTVGRFTTVSDNEGFYSLETDAGNRTIFTIREGYKVYNNDVYIPEENTTFHDIVLEIELPSEFTDIGPDFQPFPEEGTDVGPGEVDPRPEVPDVIEGQDYWIPFKTISEEIREGEFKQEVITLQSFRNSQMNIDFEVTGDAEEIVSLDRNSVSIGARGQDNVTLTMFGRGSLGEYNGSIILTGGIEEEIILDLEIIDRERVPIQALLLGTTMSDRTVHPGSSITFRTDLTNLLSDREYPVQLFYTIQNSEGTETIWTDSSNTFLRTSLSLVKRVDQLPPNLPPGEYVIRTTANYLGLSSTNSHVFQIDLPFYQYYVFGLLPVWQLAAIIAGLIGLVLAFIIIRRRIEANKKYHLKVDYKELPKPGPRSAYVGKISETDHKTYMTLENFKTHTIVAGSTGGGKSFSAQVIIEEMLMKDTAVIVFDPTAQWTGFLRKLENKGLMALYPNFGLKENDAQAFKGNIRQIDNPRELIDIRNYAKPGEIQVFALHKLDPKDMDIFVANTVRQVFRANFEESDPLKICLVYDEVHRLLPKFGGSGEGFLQIERACREFRKWGIGVMLISQVLADFVGQIKANINTEVQMRTRDEGDLDRIKTTYGEGVLQSLVKASVGSGMVQNAAYNKGRPYFTTFRPILHSVERLSDEEIAQYNDFNEKIDQINYELDQLEELKQDVFDLKLEVKLALDKVKAGNFNMVQIYLDGIEPRIKKFWDKLKKKPKKLEKQYVSEEDIKADVKKAQEERKEAEANEPKEEGKKEEKSDPSEKFKKDVNPDKILNLTNGMLVIKPSDLYAEIAAMKDADYEKHVNDKKNDFADWIKDAVGDAELAELLVQAENKEELLKYLDMRGKGEKLPAPKKKEGKEEKKEDKKSEDKKEDKPSEKKEDAKKEEKKEAPKEEKSDKKTDKKKKSDEDEEDPTEYSYEENESEGEEEFEEDVEEAKFYEMLHKQAPRDKAFKLENGRVLHSLNDLRQELHSMQEHLFEAHVNSQKNDFANWTDYVFQEKEVATKLRECYTKEQMIKVLSNE